MTLSNATLTALQKAGSAAFAADESLKKAAQGYAQRVTAAMAANPFGMGNDALIENWKVVARLSQTLAGIEAELQKVYRLAAQLSADDQPKAQQVHALAAPLRAPGRALKSKNSKPVTVVAAQPAPAPKKKAAKRPGPGASAPVQASESTANVSAQADLSPIDVVVKAEKKAAPSKTKTKAVKKANGPVAARPLGGNAAKLRQHLDTLLNTNDFVALNQTEASQATGIPMGSMTAALKKLIEGGQVVAGPSGSFKLTVSAPATGA